MAKNPVLLGAKLRTKLSAMDVVVEELEVLAKREQELEGAIDDANEEELTDVEKSMDELEKEKEEKEAAKAELEKEIDELEKEIEESATKQPKNNDEDIKGERTKMTDKTKEMRDGIKGYVRSKGQIREGFTTVEGGALIPQELLTPQMAAQDVLDLTKYVNVVAVNTGSGTYPVISKSGTKMASTAELKANPELANPEIEDVAFKIDTKRGYIAVSTEMIDDANFDVVSIITAEIADQELNTKNTDIAAAMKKATAKEVTGIDGLKGLINKEIKRVYNTKLFVSASMFNELDIAKDANGRYLLQDNITMESGKSFKGKEVVVLDDEVIGSKDGDLVAFVGDAKAAITLFDRKQQTVKWTDNDVYGELLAGIVRYDVQPTDKAAGFYITYKAEAATKPESPETKKTPK